MRKSAIAASDPAKATGDAVLVENLFDAADRRHGRRRAQHRRAGLADIGDGQAIDPRRHLFDGERPAIDQDVPRQLLRPRAGGFERGEQRDLHLRLGAMDLLLAQRMRGLGKAIERRLHQRAGVGGRRAGVKAHQPGIGIGPVESVDRISEAALFAHLLKQARGHAAAGRGGEDMGGVVIGVMRGAPFEADNDMGLAETFLGHALAAAIKRRRRGWKIVLAKRREQTFGKIDDASVLDRAGRGDDRRAGLIMTAQIEIDRGAVEGANALARAEDRPADRLFGPGGLGEEIEDEIVRRVLDRADLLQDHALFALELGRVELAVGQDVREDVERQLAILAEDAGEIGRLLDAGLGVEIAAGVLDLLGDLPGAAAARALEGHMFEQMRKPMLLRPLVARPGADKNAERSGAQLRHRVGDDPQAGLELGNLDAHAAALARARMNWRTVPRSFGRIAKRSFFSNKPFRWSGSAGRPPVARATASGNLAGWAVASAIIGVEGSRAKVRRAALTPTALCGSSG